MRKLASMVAVVAFAALLAACSGSRATVCAPPCEPVPAPCPPPPCPPPERTRACASWPEYQDPNSPNAYPGRWYLQQIISDNRWPDVVLAATQCRDNVSPSHAHTSATCYRLWLHVKAAYEANNRGDHDACIGELNHPDHAN
jgi:hypothetical protein